MMPHSARSDQTSKDEEDEEINAAPRWSYVNNVKGIVETSVGRDSGEAAGIDGCTWKWPKIQFNPIIGQGFSWRRPLGNRGP